MKIDIKQMVIGLSLIALIFFSGCSTDNYKSMIETVKIEDTGSYINNYEQCKQEALKICKNNYGWNCKGIRYNDPKIVCEKDECICL